MDKVAVVILNWNGSDMMHKYLPGVVACTETTSRAKVYVADNGSTDGSMEMVGENFPTVGKIQLDRNYGFAEGYNKSLRLVEAEYYVLLNSDVEIRDKGWLDPLVAYMDSHPDVGACQPKLMSLRNDGMFEYAGASGGFLDRYGYPFCRGRVFDRIEADKGQYDEVSSLLWATGACLMVRAECYWSVGGLDPDFFAHMEEIDFCWRMRGMGYGIVCLPMSKVYHLGGATLSKENPRKTYLNFRNNRLMLYKNLPEKELRWVLFVRYFLDLLAALQFVMKGHLRDAKAVVQALRGFGRMKGRYKSRRRDVQSKRVVETVPERRRFLLLWQFYVLGRKTYDRLPLTIDH